MADILLATINARYIHTAFGLRYLHANLGELKGRCSIHEFDTGQSAKEIALALVSEDPIIIGFGVYIWNTERTRQVVSLIKKIRPDITIIIGGPEVSYEFEQQPLFTLCDYLITGEADRSFAELCRAILRSEPPSSKVIYSRLPELSQVELPYELYSDDDIAHRVIYVEVSRGCPFTCEFCLSSVDIPVRQFDHARVLLELDKLYTRGARVFKFVDRTFNLNIRTSAEILEFFLKRMTPGLFVHFEMVPDRFPQALREIVAKFPAGALQLEIGVQSLNPEVGERISRRQDVAKLLDNLSFLRTHTHAHLHVDLIVGLPGEGVESFARGFDTLVAVDPHEIQVGILKRLRGTPIIRHTEEYSLTFSEDPPYEILCTRDLSFSELQRMERFARYWDLVSNSGNFVLSRGLIWRGLESPFEGFMHWSDWLFSKVGRRASIELKSLTALLFEYLCGVRGLEREQVGEALAADYQRGGRSDLPPALREFSARGAAAVAGRESKMKRQRRFASEGGSQKR